MARLRILACQIDVPATSTAFERDCHLDRIAERIRGLLDERHHDLVVLPELSSIDYSGETFARLDALAEPLDGPSLQRFGPLAWEFGATIVYGIARRGADGCYITQVAVDRTGNPIGHFDKVHLAQFGCSMEKDHFKPGAHLFVFRHCGVTIAPIVCYDIRIPELTRALVLEHGVELLLHCSAHARDETFYSWHHFSICRAIENQIHVLSLNRAGEHYGNSIFCPPWMDEANPALRFPQTEEVFRTIEVDSEVIARVRKRYPLLDDRAEDYSGLTSRASSATSTLVVLPSPVGMSNAWGTSPLRKRR